MSLLPADYFQDQQHRLWTASDNDSFLDTLANICTNMQPEQDELEAVGRAMHKPAGLLIPTAISPDSCAMVESRCTLPWPQESVQVLYDKVNQGRGNMPLPSPPYSSPLPALPKLEMFSDNYQPPHSALVPTLEPISPSCLQHQHQPPPLHSVLVDAPQQHHQPHNGHWWGNVLGNSGPWSAPATHATTHGTIFSHPSITSPIQLLGPSAQTTQQTRVGMVAVDTAVGPVSIPQQLQQQPQMEPDVCWNNNTKTITAIHPNCNTTTTLTPIHRVANSLNTINETKKKPQYKCHFPGCDKIYSRTSHLQAHLKLHTGERPFVCNWLFCGKRFTRSEQLHKHRCTHIGEKKFICKECSKRFMRSDHLSRHMKTHLKNNTKGRDSQGSGSSSLKSCMTVHR